MYSKLFKESILFIIFAISLVLYPKITQAIFLYFGVVIIFIISVMIGGGLLIGCLYLLKKISPTMLLIAIPSIGLSFMALYAYLVYQYVSEPYINHFCLMTGYITFGLIGIILLLRILFSLFQLLKTK